MKKTFKKPTKTLVIFASGYGSNALNIIEYFDQNPIAEVKAVFCNNPKAKVMSKAKNQNVEVVLFDKKQLQQTNFVLNQLKEISPDLIILAGFLLKIPENIIEAFHQKIINIHPSLLPKYGGKGMYGDHVHRAVINNNEKESGISIHYVNSVYDDGQIIAQFKTPLNDNDDINSLKSKIKTLEQKHFPETIAKILNHG
ncbi:phosphoribosylglycinamide formyltransferase [Flavobacterium sp. CS20]|uniref:phosphoribosylglycinamide formyltransferase n=1 Tax=Flavobacterium sp. CS20 TaxID=2775246 RepID=UPI001B39EB06|nr:phosphoribosylglycinamide formyltransferase [Flavobacterium sp. CS20]QTY26305.1 phosphoribosylglycinamide formyltransferase [Flavobacterium sp. CS20]